MQALAPVILEFLLTDETSRAIKGEADLLLTLECVRAVEVLMTSQNLRVVKSGDDEEKADAQRVEQLLIFLVSFPCCFNFLPNQGCTVFSLARKLKQC
jgi:hypothetical protein